MMVEIARYFEGLLAGLDASVLVAAGIGCVAAGLFVWLGGLGFRKALVFIVGAVSGGVIGYFATNKDVRLTIAAAAIAAVVAVVLERIFVTVLGAALAAVSCLVVMSWMYTLDLSMGLGQVQMPIGGLVVTGVVAITFLVGGFCFRRLASAFCCAALGTLLLSGGMAMLLTYKGAAPMSYVYDRPSLFAAVLGIMMVFGAIAQLLFCKKAGVKAATGGEGKKGEEPKGKRPGGWRRS